MEKLIDKIQKLLDKAESTNSEAEAQAFFMKAQELMARNNLKLSDINRKQEKHTIDKSDVTSGRKATAKRWLKLASIIANNFRVEALVRKGTGVYFIGLEGDLVIATKVFKSAQTFMERRRGQIYRKALKNGEPTKGIRESWEMRFLTGLEENFRKNVEEKALMIIKPPELVEHLENMNYESKSIKANIRNKELFYKGLEEGKGFNKQIE